MPTTNKPQCDICEDQGIDERLAMMRPCDACRAGKLQKLLYLSLKHSAMQQELYALEREIQHLEQALQLGRNDYV